MLGHLLLSACQRLSRLLQRFRHRFFGRFFDRFGGRLRRATFTGHLCLGSRTSFHDILRGDRCVRLLHNGRGRGSFPFSNQSLQPRERLVRIVGDLLGQVSDRFANGLLARWLLKRR